MGCSGSTDVSCTTPKVTGASSGKVIFYYDPVSQPCRSVEYVLKKLRIQYTPKYTQAMVGTKTAEFKKINKYQKVPALDHNGFIIVESASIVRYLCNTFEGADKIFPCRSLQEKAYVDMWIDW